MTVFDKIMALTRQLYPTGRAFKMFPDSFMEAVHRGLAKSEERAFNYAMSTLHGILPDNANFTADDATAWERRLGLKIEPTTPLEMRKLAIKRKMNHPGDIPARQSAKYLEYQLQSAGFGVYVYENRFPDGLGGYTTKSPLELTGGIGGRQLQHGEVQHGTNQHGTIFDNLIVNYIEEEKDATFGIANLKQTFFIGGDPIGSFASVPVERKNEFRHLILRTKPVHAIGFLLVNYV